MQLLVHKDHQPERFLDIVHFFYREEEASADDRLAGKYLTQAYLQACDEKTSQQDRWDHLLRSLSSVPGIRHIRDLSHDPRHAYKAMISGEDNQTGIVFYLSYLGDLFGAWYIDEHAEDNKHPIRPAMMKNYCSDLSYIPFGSHQATLVASIRKEIASLFPGFGDFDNTYAGSKVPAVQIEKGFFKNIDLFQVLFDIHMHGLF